MGRNLRAEMELRFSGLLWVVLVAILGVSTPSGEEAHLGPIDEAVSLISLDNQQADAGPEDAKAPDYGDDSPKNDGADAYTKIPNFVFQHMANQKLSAAKDQLSNMRSQNQIRQAFDRGYFDSAGSAHEKKTKEVKLKTQEIKQKDALAAKESFNKSGEFQAKKAASVQERKVADAEIGIQTTKERMRKVTNKQLKKRLDAEASKIAGMGTEEADSIETIKDKHRKKIGELKDQVYEAQQELR